MWGEDVRVRDKTKKKIASSLMNLVEKKPIDKITITDITVNCDISRQVFYRYFLDKKDLINWIYEEDCGSVIYTGEEKFSIKSWLNYIIDILAEKKNHISVILLSVGANLSSRAVASRVFSAQTSLTSVFGMGTGGPSL